MNFYTLIESPNRVDTKNNIFKNCWFWLVMWYFKNPKTHFKKGIFKEELEMHF